MAKRHASCKRPIRAASASRVGQKKSILLISFLGHPGAKHLCSVWRRYCLLPDRPPAKSNRCPSRLGGASFRQLKLPSWLSLSCKKIRTLRRPIRPASFFLSLRHSSLRRRNFPPRRFTQYRASALAPRPATARCCCLLVLSLPTNSASPLCHSHPTDSLATHPPPLPIRSSFSSRRP
jgi:hypothetical protein